MATPVTLVDTNQVPVRGAGVSVSTTRPNDTNAYSAGDVIGSSTSSGGAVWTFTGFQAGEFMITSATLEIDVAAIPSGMTTFELALYSATPPSAYGDNTAWDVPSGDRSVYIGRLQLGAPSDLGSTLHVSTDGINKQITLTGASLYAYLITDAGYTPTASAVYKVALHGLPI